MIDADFSEVNRLAGELGAAGAKAERESESQVLAKYGALLRDKAVATAPVRTGELRGSIYLRGGKGYRKVGSDVRQGFFQEFGTSVMAPQPWLWIHVPEIHRGMDEAMAKIGDPFD
jgi:HK97 gp10 family phage protein